jgi:hypothetical protein
MDEVLLLYRDKTRRRDAIVAEHSLLLPRTVVSIQGQSKKLSSEPGLLAPGFRKEWNWGDAVERRERTMVRLVDCHFKNVFPPVYAYAAFFS